MNTTDSFFLVGRTEIEAIKNCQFEILKKLNELDKNNKNNALLDSPYITALEFMEAVRIRRWKFNCLVKSGKIMTMKKKRKIYVLKGEIERYFLEVQE
jgi:transcription initiation factor IIE alpha subunit